MSPTRRAYVEKVYLNFGDLGEIQVSALGAIDVEGTFTGGYSAQAKVESVTLTLRSAAGSDLKIEIRHLLNNQAIAYLKEKLVDAYWDDFDLRPIARDYDGDDAA